MPFLELIRSISDPEHPNSLEELRVVSTEQIEIGENHIVVEFTPTVPHCGMSTLIGKIEFLPSDDEWRSFFLALRVVYPSEAVAQSSTKVQNRYPVKAWFSPERVIRCAPLHVYLFTILFLSSKQAAQRQGTSCSCS